VCVCVCARACVCACVRVVPNMAIFSTSLFSFFPQYVAQVFSADFKIVPVASVTNGITSVLHSTCAVFLL